MRIKSGDSFNYFLSNGTLATKGTELDVYPLTQSHKAFSSKIILKEIKEIIKFNKEKSTYGDVNNLIRTFPDLFN
jgi:hypothetical protein